MKQETNTNEEIIDSKNFDKQPKRKGIYRIFRVTRLDMYFSLLATLFFVGILGLKLNGREVAFISWTDALILAVLFSILGMISRIYYKFFEEKYEKKKKNLIIRD